MARSGVFSYTEADRGTFDFACHLEQEKRRLIVGQTLQKHAAGIEKDLNTLLMDEEDSVPVYLYSDTAKHVSRTGEVLKRARNRLPGRVELLRLYPYPSFDADMEDERETVKNVVREHVINDLLLNVIFGRLSAVDLLIFLNDVGFRGLQLAVLESIATQGFFNYPKLRSVLNEEVSIATLRPRVANLVAAGMLLTPIGGSCYWLTQRGRVFLKIVSLLQAGKPTNELNLILRRLGLLDSDSNGEQTETEVGELLKEEISACGEDFGLCIVGGPYEDDPAERLPLLAKRESLRWVER